MEDTPEITPPVVEEISKEELKQELFKVSNEIDLSRAAIKFEIENLDGYYEKISCLLKKRIV